MSPELRVLLVNLEEPLSLADAKAISSSWKATNKRRAELIDKKAAKRISAEEMEEFKRLQRLVGLRRRLAMPLPIKELAKIEAHLRKSGLWRGA